MVRSSNPRLLILLAVCILITVLSYRAGSSLPLNASPTLWNGIWTGAAPQSHFGWPSWTPNPSWTALPLLRPTTPVVPSPAGYWTATAMPTLPAIDVQQQSTHAWQEQQPLPPWITWTPRPYPTPRPYLKVK